jgi:hypothetical protein
MLLELVWGRKLCVDEFVFLAAKSSIHLMNSIDIRNWVPGLVASSRSVTSLISHDDAHSCATLGKQSFANKTTKRPYAKIATPDVVCTFNSLTPITSERSLSTRLFQVED